MPPAEEEKGVNAGVRYQESSVGWRLRLKLKLSRTKVARDRKLHVTSTKEVFFWHVI
jgi:hypothetical protein